MHLHRSELTPGPTARSHRADGLLVAGAVIGAAWLLGAVSHSAGIPRTDDWAFARVAFTLHRSGHVHLVGWAQMSLLGLVAWAQPWLAVFGDHQWVLDLSGSVLVAAGMVAAYRLARLLVGRTAALVVVLTVAVAPGFIRDAGSFMTDAPAMAVGTFALLAGVAAANAEGRRRWVLEAACVAAGCWAFSIRELAVAAPVAVLAGRWVGERSRRQALGVELAILGAFCVAFWAWFSGLSGRQAFDGRPPVFTIASLLVGVLFSTALLLVPVLAATAPSWWRPGRPVARAIGMVVAGGLALVPVAYAPGSWTHRYQWLAGDYLDPRGINGNKLLVGSRPRLVPPIGWACIEGVAIVAGIVLAGLVAEAVAGALRRPSGLGPFAGRVAAAPLGLRVLVAHLCVLFVLLVDAIITNGATFDRYLWPAVLSGGLLLVMRYRVPPLAEWSPVASQVALVAVTACALVSLMVTLDSDSYDGARWRLARSAAAARLAPTAVDGGFEWAGSHASGVANAGASSDATRPYWLAMVGEPAACVELAASPIADANLTLVRTAVWHRWLLFGSARLYEYRRATACGGA